MYKVKFRNSLGKLDIYRLKIAVVIGTFLAVSAPKLGGVVNLRNETLKISSNATIRKDIGWLSHAENILEIGRPPSFGPARFSQTTTLN